MIPAPFDYEVAESAEHAIALLGEREDAKLLAGGHSLLPAMKLRSRGPRSSSTSGGSTTSRYVREDGEQIAIGALTRHKDVATPRAPPRALPDRRLTRRARSATRRCGTAGRSAARSRTATRRPTCRPCSSRSTASSSSVGRAASGRFRRSTSSPACSRRRCAPDEMLVEIRVPKLGPSTGWSYVKMARRAQDWATVAVAAVVERSNGSIGKASIALTNMGATPVRATAAEEAIADGASIDDAAALAARGHRAAVRPRGERGVPPASRPRARPGGRSRRRRRADRAGELGRGRERCSVARPARRT